MRNSLSTLVRQLRLRERFDREILRLDHQLELAVDMTPFVAAVEFAISEFIVVVLIHCRGFGPPVVSRQTHPVKLSSRMATTASGTLSCSRHSRGDGKVLSRRLPGEFNKINRAEVYRDLLTSIHRSLHLPVGVLGHVLSDLTISGIKTPSVDCRCDVLDLYLGRIRSSVSRERANKTRASE